MDHSLEATSLTREDLSDWRNNPVTQIILAEINNLIKEAHLNLGGGVVLDAERPENTAQNYAKMVGYIAGLRVILNIEVQEDNEEIQENASSNR